MGRTVPLFRISLAMEKRRKEGKPFPNALDKSDGKKFDVPLSTIILMSPASSEVYRATDWNEYIQKALKLTFGTSFLEKE